MPSQSQAQENVRKLIQSVPAPKRARFAALYSAWGRAKMDKMITDAKLKSGGRFGIYTAEFRARVANGRTEPTIRATLMREFPKEAALGMSAAYAGISTGGIGQGFTELAMIAAVVTAGAMMAASSSTAATSTASVTGGGFLEGISQTAASTLASSEATIASVSGSSVFSGTTAVTTATGAATVTGGSSIFSSLGSVGKYVNMGTLKTVSDVAGAGMALTKMAAAKNGANSSNQLTSVIQAGNAQAKADAAKRAELARLNAQIAAKQGAEKKTDFVPLLIAGAATAAAFLI